MPLKSQRMLVLNCLTVSCKSEAGLLLLPKIKQFYFIFFYFFSCYIVTTKTFLLIEINQMKSIK